MRKICTIILTCFCTSLQVMSQDKDLMKRLVKKGNAIYISEGINLYELDKSTITVKVKSGSSLESKYKILRKNKLGYTDT